MWKDPIVEEIHKSRVQYANQFNHDIEHIFRDIQKRQAQTDKNLISFPARLPNKIPDREEKQGAT